VKTVNIQAAKTHLSRLVEEAAAGEEIVLAKAGKPIARLVSYRMLIAQAICEGLTIVTADPVLQGYPVRVIRAD